jgi:hypothetical protein
MLGHCLAAAALASTGVGAEIIRKEEMLHAITTTRERCHGQRREF